MTKPKTKTWLARAVASGVLTAIVGCNGGSGGPTVPFGQQKIVFASRQSGVADIYMMNPNGSNQQRLTNNPIFEQEPSLSPRRDKVVLTAYEDGSNPVIHLLDISSKAITKLSPSGANEYSAEFNPRTGEIIFVSDRDGAYEVYSMNQAGGAVKKLTNLKTMIVNSPAVTPDGQTIAFTGISGADTAGGEIFTISSNGGVSTQISRPITPNDFGQNSADPSFSPDGSKIVFTYYGHGKGEIYIMNANGDNPQRLTNNNAYDGQPKFSPDGQKIVFVSDRDNALKPNIYAMNVDGSNVQRLTTTAQGDDFPDWQ